MKTQTNIKKLYFLTVMFLVMSQIAIAQTYADEEQTEEELIVEGDEVSQQVLTNLGISTQVNPRSATLTGRLVTLRQIGDFNNANIQVSAEAGDISVTQNGNNNFTGLNYRVRTVIADLQQNGDFNQIRDFVNDPTAETSLELDQNGDFLNFEREGINDLTKSLKFTQTEGTPSLIIRSFN